MAGLGGSLNELGDYIREHRMRAQVSLRQLAAQAGVSNPYLSQIERGLRKPSAEVLGQIAAALKISTPIMFGRAGLFEGQDQAGVAASIASDDGLTDRQKQILIEVYESFRRENSTKSTVDEAAAVATERAAAALDDRKTEKAEN